MVPLLAAHLKTPTQITVLGELIRMTSSNRAQRQSEAIFADGRIFQIAAIPLPDGNTLFNMLALSDRSKMVQTAHDADAVQASFLPD